MVLQPPTKPQPTHPSQGRVQNQTSKPTPGVPLPPPAPFDRSGDAFINIPLTPLPKPRANMTAIESWLAIDAACDTVRSDPSRKPTHQSLPPLPSCAEGTDGHVESNLPSRNNSPAKSRIGFDADDEIELNVLDTSGKRSILSSKGVPAMPSRSKLVRASPQAVSPAAEEIELHELDSTGRRSSIPLEGVLDMPSRAELAEADPNFGSLAAELMREEIWRSYGR